MGTLAQSWSHQLRAAGFVRDQILSVCVASIHAYLAAFFLPFDLDLWDVSPAEPRDRFVVGDLREGEVAALAASALTTNHSGQSNPQKSLVVLIFPFHCRSVQDPR